MNPLIAALVSRPYEDVVLQGSDSSLTAVQLLMRVYSLRKALVSSGIDRLGILAGNSMAWIIADLACQVADICLLPLPIFFADKQLLHSIKASGVDAVLTDDAARSIELIGAEQLLADPADWFGLTLLQLRAAERSELPAGTQKITFTSGSTGAPRGVCLGLDQQLRVAHSLHTVLDIPEPRHLCLLPLSTLLENIGGIYYPLLAAGSVIAPNETETGFSGSTGLHMRSMLQAIDRHRPTSVILHPQMLVGLVAALEGGWQPPVELQFAAVGGGKVSAALISRARQLGLPVYEGYGLSETGSVACLNYPGNDLIGSVGKPLAHVDVRVAEGEVFISGNSFLGYLNDPDSWAAQEVATGDMGEQDADGYLHLQGRKKNLLISSFGRNISPEWVESEVLLNPEISQCVVFGDARPYCIALIAPARSDISEHQVQQLIAEVNASLPDYARVQYWHRLTQPLTSAEGLCTENGRPRRAEIAARFAAEIELLYTSQSFANPRKAASL
jgi:long-chain acyl-CoA synthetase